MSFTQIFIADTKTEPSYCSYQYFVKQNVSLFYNILTTFYTNIQWAKIFFFLLMLEEFVFHSFNSCSRFLCSVVFERRVWIAHSERTRKVNSLQRRSTTSYVMGKQSTYLRTMHKTLVILTLKTLTLLNA